MIDHFHPLVEGNPTIYRLLEDSDGGSDSKAILVIYFMAVPLFEPTEFTVTGVRGILLQPGR